MEFWQRRALRLADIKHEAGPEAGDAPLLVAFVGYDRPGTGHDDGDPFLAFANEASKLASGVEARHLGCLGTLHGYQQLVAE